jgi:hypothetical protein
MLDHSLSSLKKIEDVDVHELIENLKKNIDNWEGHSLHD